MKIYHLGYTLIKETKNPYQLHKHFLYLKKHIFISMSNDKSHKFEMIDCDLQHHLWPWQFKSLKWNMLLYNFAL